MWRLAEIAPAEHRFSFARAFSWSASPRPPFLTPVYKSKFSILLWGAGRGASNKGLRIRVAKLDASLVRWGTLQPALSFNLGQHRARGSPLQRRSDGTSPELKWIGRLTHLGTCATFTCSRRAMKGRHLFRVTLLSVGLSAAALAASAGELAIFNAVRAMKRLPPIAASAARAAPVAPAAPSAPTKK